MWELTRYYKHGCDFPAFLLTVQALTTKTSTSVGFSHTCQIAQILRDHVMK